VIAPVIVGETEDPHVAAVLRHLEVEPVVVDAASIAEARYGWLGDRLLVGSAELGLTSVDGRKTRGWIRRVAPADWLLNVQAESVDAAVRAAWLTMIGALLRSQGISWLTSIDRISAAENKLVADAAAQRVGLTTPHTVVTNDRRLLSSQLGDDVVVKPLGPGHYFVENRGFNVFAQTIRLEDLSDQVIGEAPFLFQERLSARRHHRIVVVAGEVWGGSLDAEGLPLDWRSEPAAHRSFEAGPVPPELRSAALALAAELGLGYASQDWVESNEGYVILDVNPSGQWLFLPDPVAEDVARAIAGWLGDDR
jgi:glutathione synthase/RimK-type ligase-like ATP-grasp enzyme